MKNVIPSREACLTCEASLACVVNEVVFGRDPWDSVRKNESKTGVWFKTNSVATGSIWIKEVDYGECPYVKRSMSDM